MEPSEVGHANCFRAVRPATRRMSPDEEGARPNDDLLYRRQFILGPRFVDFLPASWTRLQVREGLCLSAHPELHAITAVRGSRSLTLLGYIIDPDNPDLDEANTLKRLLECLEGKEEFQDWVVHTSR